MQEIPVNARVECTDGPCGTSVAVIVNPTRRTVTFFVVEDKSFLDPNQRLVPIEQVAETTSDLIRLQCSKAELAEMEHFVERHFIDEQWDDPAYWYSMTDMYMEPYVTPALPPYEEVERIPPGQLAVRRGTWVEATDGHVGTVGELVIDPTSGHISHLVLQEGHLWGKKEITLPLSAIDRVEADAVYLKLDKPAIERLPSVPLRRPYRKAKAEGRDIELVARVFDDPDRADEALKFVEDLHRQKAFRLLNAAVLVKAEDGTTSLKDTKDLEPRRGRILGAIAGGLVGLLAGPVGAVVGALAGVGAGSLAAKWVDLGFSDKFLAELQEHLQPGSSALIVLVEHEWAQPMSDALAGLEGVVLQQTLTDELVQELIENIGSEEQPQAGGEH
jgi:uncharacterized membrane protein